MFKVPAQAFDPVLNLVADLADAMQRETFADLPNVRCVVPRRDNPINRLPEDVPRELCKRAFYFCIQVLDLVEKKAVVQEPLFRCFELKQTDENEFQFIVMPTRVDDKVRYNCLDLSALRDAFIASVKLKEEKLQEFNSLATMRAPRW